MPHRDPSLDLARVRYDLAAIAVRIGLIRIERDLLRKDWSDQPREPAGQPGGGRWTSSGSSGDAPPASGDDPETTGSIGVRDARPRGAESSTREEIVTADGARVLTIRIRANPRADWDEQHIVTAPDGARTVFETSGLVQTIRDGETSEILGRSRLTAQGAVPEAVVQPARGRHLLPRDWQRAVERRARQTIEAALSIFAALSSRTSRDRTAVFAAPASDYLPGDAYNERAVWVGAVSQRDLDRICPRNREVQDTARRVAADVRREGGYATEQEFGNRVHADIAKIVNKQNDPVFLQRFRTMPRLVRMRATAQSERSASTSWRKSINRPSASTTTRQARPSFGLRARSTSSASS